MRYDKTLLRWDIVGHSALAFGAIMKWKELSYRRYLKVGTIIWMLRICPGKSHTGKRNDHLRSLCVDTCSIVLTARGDYAPAGFLLLVWTWTKDRYSLHYIYNWKSGHCARDQVACKRCDIIGSVSDQILVTIRRSATYPCERSCASKSLSLQSWFR